jgi:hypothetical protein
MADYMHAGFALVALTRKGKAVKRALIKYVLIIAVACGVLNGAELTEESARVCSVAVQDRGELR